MFILMLLELGADNISIPTVLGSNGTQITPKRGEGIHLCLFISSGIIVR